MRVIFMGTPDFAVGTLEEIIKAGHEVVLVVSQPDKAVGRSKALRYTPVKACALEHGIEVYQPQKVRDSECIERLRTYHPDIIIVEAFGQIIPRAILDMPRYGCVNVHASLLPKYRGAAPIQWVVIDGEKEKATIAQQFGEIPSIYIADGHHRAASAVKVGLKRRAEHPDYDGTEEFNYFLSVVFPYDQLTILAYNRVVKDLHGMDEHAFIASLKFNFELMIMPGFPCKPVEKHCMGMYVGGNWYHLKAWDDVYAKKDIVGQLDVSILQEKVLSPILGIGDPRTDQRIRFVGGSHKLSELAQIADSTGGVAFAMFPTAMEDLMQIADESKLMPPKSTWFEPKLRSGLFIHKLS